MKTLTTLLTLAVKYEKARTNKTKLMTRLQAGKIRKALYYKEVTTKNN
jgi:hypothetical protein